ncbi:MAG: Holliday junction resolvase RuvX [Hyphomicrobiaceae bacterium]|nr:MAG: Holliday junction resolvase RuvX [Hyphomicrobiaceae bacterium]
MRIEELARLLPARGRLLGLDVGTKTIGIAVSDLERRIATAHTTIARAKFSLDAEKLLALAAKEAAVGFVVGLPINLDGSEGPRAQSTRAFVRNLVRLTPLPVAFWDERLSTVAAERPLLEADLSRAKRARVIDQAAAAFILQGALDRLNRLARNS